MLVVPIAVVVATIFAGLSALHVYWAAGGQRGLKLVFPELDGRPLIRPGPGGTMLVALLLATAALLVLGRGAVGPLLFPSLAYQWGSWGVAAVLTVRAIGEFKYVGFFKRRRGTDFAKWDTRLFSPLALGLGVGAGLVAWAGA